MPEIVKIGNQKKSTSISYEKPSANSISGFINYIPSALTNIITSNEIIEEYIQEKMVYLFKKCILEAGSKKIVGKIPEKEVDTDEMLDIVRNKFVFSSSLNPYEFVSSVLEDSDYHGEFYVTNQKKIIFIPKIREKTTGFIDLILGPNNSDNLREKFARSLDGFHFVLFSNRFQTFDGSESQSQIITLDHLKNIALFTCLLDLPFTFIEFIFEETVDNFFRSLIVYFQYYLQLWDALIIRSEIKKRKLPNPHSSKIEQKWQQNLNDLRFFIARNYIIMILGANPNMKNYHHLNRKFCITGNDVVNYELLYQFSTQILLMIFNYENDPRTKQIIIDQINKLFKDPVEGTCDPYAYLSPGDRSLLEGKFPIPLGWNVSSPCLLEIKRPGRDPKFLHIGKSIVVTKNKRLRILQSALLVPDSKLEEANIKLGILGKPRADYPPMLNCTQITYKERNEGLVERKVHPTYLRDVKLDGMRWKRPVLIVKEFPDKPYNTDYTFLIHRTESKKDIINQWKKYAHASDRFWYRIDPHFTVVDCFRKKFLELFVTRCQKKANFERKIKYLVQKIRRD